MSNSPPPPPPLDPSNFPPPPPHPQQPAPHYPPPQYPPGASYGQNPYAQDSFSSYVPLTRQLSGMGMAAMVMGILGLLLSVLIVGGLLGIVAITLASISLVQIRKRPQTLGGKGFALAGLGTGAASIVVTILALVYITSSPMRSPFSRSRELSNRAACAANLRSIGMAMMIYANDNADAFPVTLYAPYSAALNSPTAIAFAAPSGRTGSTLTPPQRAITAMYARPGANFAGSPTAGAWLLVLRNDASPRSFLCRSDPFAAAAPALLSPRGSADFFNNFQNGNQLSYSFAYPWTRGGDVGGWWRNTTDSSLPTASDMAPRNGTGAPLRVTNPPAFPRNLRTWNSSNHFGDGQTVAYADVHVEFARRPDVGQNSDNIWTTAEHNDPRLGGAPFGGHVADPGAFRAPVSTSSPFDVIMVPVRDASTGAM